MYRNGHVLQNGEDHALRALRSESIKGKKMANRGQLRYVSTYRSSRGLAVKVAMEHAVDVIIVATDSPILKFRVPITVYGFEAQSLESI
jgi:hypothetical protein